MTVAALLRELHQLGIRIEIRDDRLYCAAPRKKVPSRLQKALGARREQLLVRLREDREKEDRKWVMTPDGPGKIWDFLPKGRVGVVLRSDIGSRPEGQRPVRFYPIRHIRPFNSKTVIFCEPPADPDGSRWRTEAVWKFAKIRRPRIDGEGVDEWIVGTRVDRPGVFRLFWSVNIDRRDLEAGKLKEGTTDGI